MEVKCIVIELKANSKERIEQWASFILSKKEQALLTLKKEGVSVENFFYVQIESKEYLIAYMRAKSFAQAAKVVEKSLCEIDIYHKQFQKDCWIKGIKTKSVLELDRLVDEHKII